MKPLKILILEDDVTIAKDLKEILIRQGNTSCKICRTLDEAKIAAKFEEFDMAIIDILLENGESGIDFAKEINNSYPMPFVYLTAHSGDENFRQAIATNPAAYLIKPFKERELSFQLQLAYANFHNTSNSNSVFFLPTSKGFKKISKAEVTLLEANKSSTYIYLTTNKLPELFSINLGYLAQFFKAPDFFQISRSAIINLSNIEEIEGNDIILSNISKKIKISENRKNEFLKTLFIIRRPK